MNSYSIVVPNKKAGSYRLISLIIAFMNIGMFVFALLGNPTSTVRWIIITGIVVVASALAHYFFIQKNSKTTVYINFSFILCGFIWLILGLYFSGAGMMLFGVFGIYANKPLRLVFKEDGIWYPSFPAKIIPWENIEQVMLKDNVLTIDLINNNLLQFSVTNNESLPPEKEFNEYCRRYGGLRG
jgi:hypothetical protein